MADPQDVPTLKAASAAKWRAWLREHHARSRGVWLVFYKKHVNKRWIGYDEAVEEALCYGWVDSIVRRIDEDTYVQKFTPRKSTSAWSTSNRRRIEALTAAGRMRAPGLAIVEAAKRNGRWDQKTAAETEYAMPSELSAVLAKNRRAKAEFGRLSPAQRRQYIMWIASAKREPTRLRRAEEAAERLERGERLGLK